MKLQNINYENMIFFMNYDIKVYDTNFLEAILKTRKGSKAYLSSSERYLTLHMIRHRP